MQSSGAFAVQYTSPSTDLGVLHKCEGETFKDESRVIKWHTTDASQTAVDGGFC